MIVEQCDEICKYFAKRKQRDANANEVQKQLQLYDLSIGEYLTDKYALWLDFRMMNEMSYTEWVEESEVLEEESPCKLRRRQKQLESLKRTFTSSWMPS